MRQEQINSPKGRPILIIESIECKKTLSLNSQIFLIGRHPKCSLILQDKTISRYHATIAWLRERDNLNKYAHWIIDGKGSKQRSKNGIFVNGIRTVLHQLNFGDVITLGNDTTITYSHIEDTTENIQIKNVVYYL